MQAEKQRREIFHLKNENRSIIIKDGGNQASARGNKSQYRGNRRKSLLLLAGVPELRIP